jgi:hypothetical protein
VIAPVGARVITPKSQRDRYGPEEATHRHPFPIPTVWSRLIFTLLPDLIAGIAMFFATRLILVIILIDGQYLPRAGIHLYIHDGPVGIHHLIIQGGSGDEVR